MGQKNNVICSYLSNPDIFADFINGCIHKGRKKVFPEQLSVCESVYYQKQNQGAAKGQKPRYIARQKDVVKAICGSNCYIMIGIEAQDKANDIMPLRCMEYDAVEYRRQLRELKRNRKKKLTGSEFLSGRAKDEKLTPATTIVFYHGEEPYDGCVDLYDMLELNEKNKTYKRFISNYHVNLIKVEELDESVFKTGLHELVGFLKYRNSKQELMNFIERDKEQIENMDEETFDAVQIMLNLPRGMVKGKKDNKGGGYNMCKAFQEWLADERNVGKKEGIKEGIKEGEARFAALTSVLIAAQRLDDLSKAVSDEAFRDSLYSQFGME